MVDRIFTHISLPHIRVPEVITLTFVSYKPVDTRSVVRCLSEFMFYTIQGTEASQISDCVYSMAYRKNNFINT